MFIQQILEFVSILGKFDVGWEIIPVSRISYGLAPWRGDLTHIMCYTLYTIEWYFTDFQKTVLHFELLNYYWIIHCCIIWTSVDFSYTDPLLCYLTYWGGYRPCGAAIAKRWTREILIQVQSVRTTAIVITKAVCPRERCFTPVSLSHPGKNGYQP